VSLEPSPSGSLTIDDLFVEYESSLQRFAFSLVHDLDRSDDLVQETMIRAMGNIWLLGQMNPYQQRAWLYKVLKNLFIDEERARTRKERLFEYLPELEPTAENAINNEITESILEEVPEKYRELLNSHYLQGRSTAEIAGDLGIPPATVRSRLFLARKWIRDRRKEIM
jgi:RNA polymerase sigma-70 factor (ECF subfamily)